jgi:phage gp29-like protein
MAKVIPVQSELAGGAAAGFAQAALCRALAATEWAARGPDGAYGLFAEMEDKNAHLFATLQTRKNMLAAAEWKVIEAGDSPQDRAVAGLVREVLAGIPDFRGALFHLLDAFAKGWAVLEILWTVDAATGRTMVRALRGRPAGAFALDASGRLYLLEGGAGGGGHGAVTLPGDLLPRPGETAVWARGARLMPERKFVRFVFQGGPTAPYGSPLCAKAYWYYWFKKNNVKFWAVYNEKFGAPTAVARYGAAATAEELDRLAAVLESLQSDSGVLLPEGVALEFLEARRSGATNTYREFADWCNDEISKLVLGQTLTTGEGRRSGSLALGAVHDRVRRDYVAADAQALGGALTAQLVRWIVDFNFGVSQAAPRLVFDVSDLAEFAEELKVDEQLVRMGVALPATYFHEKYRRPAPTEGERSIRYDDQNLYQYHLQFGVLTINEVRASLGLPPVAWGDAPPARPGPGILPPAGAPDMPEQESARLEARDDRARR